MNAVVAMLVDFLCEVGDDTSAITWTPPVPAFGDPAKAQVATLGLNPSNREFVDLHGIELDGFHRRFPTLRSLRLDCWQHATAVDIEAIAEACRSYFERNPYDAWFGRLDFLIQETNTSFYTPIGRATHLDVVPYATGVKWARLPQRERRVLARKAKDVLAMILRETSIQLIVLNGMSVVDTFQVLCDTKLLRTHQPEWSLPRRTGREVKGYSFTGVVDRIADDALGRDLLVLGYNHNIQSSFGITRNVCQSIREWIGSKWRARI